MKKDEHNPDEMPVSPHIGKLVKAKLDEQGRKIAWLAKQINCTRENMYKLFRRNSVNTELLFKLSKALDHDFFKDCSEYYQKRKSTHVV
ncbi:MAG: hypothetical protein J5862_03540 [Bacteroidales bacterium]|nr:hypothetical protein [Bacteroidales bacterium]